MNHKSIAWLGILGCFAIVWLMRIDANAEATTNTDQEVDSQEVNFGDGILMISVERTVCLESGIDMTVLQDARLIKLGERFFVVDKGYVSKSVENDPGWSWSKDVDIAFACNDVVELYVFTPEQLEAYIAATKDEE